MEASVKGIINFREVDFKDPMWRVRVQLLLRGLDVERRKEMAAVVQRHNLGVLNVARIDEKDFGDVQKACQNSLERIQQLYYPWEKHSKKEEEKKSAKSWIRAWNKRFGDMDDRGVKSKIDAVAEALRRRREEDPVEPDKYSEQGIFNAGTARAIQAEQDAR